MSGTMRVRTTRGYDFGEVTSAMQKAIRRSDPKVAGYFAVELFESGMCAYLWKRLFVISAEDCWGLITGEVEALFHGFEKVNDRHVAGTPWKGRIFVAKAVLLLCAAKKCRDADHLTNLVYDALPQGDAEIEAAIAESRVNPEPIPPYSYDVHTGKGRALGKTKADFFAEEHRALKPREPGLFDALVDPPRG